jgi:hypothetical protein
MKSDNPRLADDGAGLSVRLAEEDRPGGPPVITADEVIDVGGAAEFGEDDEGRFQQTTVLEIADQHGGKRMALSLTARWNRDLRQNRAQIPPAGDGHDDLP